MSQGAWTYRGISLANHLCRWTQDRIAKWVDARPCQKVAMAFEAMDTAKSGSKKPTPLELEVERLHAWVNQLVEEALSTSPTDSAQLRQAVIRQHALDIGSENEPDLKMTYADIKAVRQARARKFR